ncbi:hypothetical protein OAT44_02195 [Alphaproteobacteria bacterium]|nr:hypothetical protein [Alphaproteobacteria bacterium]MDC1086209.1 hypothetical protein [Alphaproteobacteria bacterium]
MKYFLKILFILSSFFISTKAVNAGISDQWVGYVIKAVDYAMYSGSEVKKKMIFPSSATYKSKDDCYYYFGKLLAEEPMKSNYPETSNFQTSYIFDCIEK